MADELRKESQRSNRGGGVTVSVTVSVTVGVDLEEKETGGVDESVGWEGLLVEVKRPRRGREGCGDEERKNRLQRRRERREEQSWEQYKWRERDERVTHTLSRRRIVRSEKWIFSIELSNFDLAVKERDYRNKSL